MNRSYLLFLLFLIPVSLSSCKKITEFRIKDSSEFTVPKTASLGVPLFIDTMSVSTSSAFEFKSNGTDTKHIKNIRLDQLRLTITNPSGQTFSFLESIHLYIYAEGLPEVEIAYLDNIPNTVGNTIDLVTTGAELDEYIKKDAYKLRVKTETDELLSQDVTIQSEMSFLVRAKLL